MKKNKLLLLVILLLGVGFALVSTTLLMTGNVKIATNNADFDVRFTKAVLDETDISETAISADGKTITFITSDLTTVGDISKLDFEVTNNSEMYDAVVSINCTAEGAKNSYYEITKEVASPIVGKTTGTGNVQVKLLKASVEDFSETFTCTLSATAQERTSKAEVPQIYYAVVDPLTAADRTTDYTALKYSFGAAEGQQAKVFVKLDADGVQKSVCTLATGSLECFKNNNFAEEKGRLKEVFGEANCSDESYFSCGIGDFSCRVTSDGYVSCSDKAASLRCELRADDSIHWSWP